MKMVKKAKTENLFKHTAVMAAGGKAMKGGRLIKFRDAVRANDTEAAEAVAERMTKKYRAALFELIAENCS
jgi:hypothetical protein